MTEEERRLLVLEPFDRAGIQISDEDAAFLIELAGGHPLFLQIACYHFFETLDSAIALVTEDWWRLSFYKEAESHYAAAWRYLDEKEKTACTQPAPNAATGNPRGIVSEVEGARCSHRRL